MRTFFILLLSCLSCSAQFVVQQPFFLSVSGSSRWWPTNATSQTMYLWLETVPFNSAGGTTWTALTDGQRVKYWTNVVTKTIFETSDQPQGPTNYTSGGGVSGTAPRLCFTSAVGSTRMVTGSDPKGTTTFVIVANCDSPSTENNILMIPAGGTYIRYNSSRIQISAGTQLQTPATITSNYYVISVIFNGANSRIDTNGVTAASGNAGTTGWTQYYMGQNTFYKGNICRVWGWTNVLSDSELTTAVNQCKTDYGIP